MTVAPWDDAWWASAAPRQMHAWRGVQAQPVAATMRLVDSLDEQAVLDTLLGNAAPPAAAARKHPLLATPFAQRPRHGSRFRRPGALGVWYGAATLRTACAEVAYWRWRFVIDSAGLAGQELLTQHTFFRAEVDGLAIDLSAAPWSTRRERWAHDSDYSATQALAAAAHERAVQWIHYESVRDPGGWCAAVLDVAALQGPDPTSLQTWHCRATASAVRLVHGDGGHEWRFGPPSPPG